MGLTRLSVHQDNRKKGDPRVWMVEGPDGSLVAAERVLIRGRSWTKQGQLAYGPTLWIETEAEVILVNPRPA